MRLLPRQPLPLLLLALASALVVGGGLALFGLAQMSGGPSVLEEAGEKGRAATIPSEEGGAVPPRRIDPYDLKAVLGAREGDIIGIRGERLMVTNGVRHLVPLDEILSGGPPPDGIPSIDNPRFISAEEASEWLSDEEFVLGVVYNGRARAYPHQILVWHEIVNDDFDGEPLLVTYCPLCFTGMAFIPRIGDEVVEFGTSGKLYNSNLVMYDRKTGSLWSQVTGQAIVGELAGYALRQVPVDTMRWGEWRRLHPDTQVLSRDTGFYRPYGEDPYGNYYVGNGPLFPVASRDDRLPPMSIVYGILVEGRSKAYPVDEVLKAGGLVNDFFEGKAILVLQLGEERSRGQGSAGVFNPALRIFERSLEGMVLEFVREGDRLTDLQTGSIWDLDGRALEGPLAGKALVRIPSSPEFWFVRSSFYQGTELFKAD